MMSKKVEHFPFCINYYMDVALYCYWLMDTHDENATL